MTWRLRTEEFRKERGARGKKIRKGTKKQDKDEK